MPKEAPLLILRRGRVWTGDQASPWAETVVVRDGRIAFVGRDDDVGDVAGARDIDLRGRLLLPAFIDAHAHLFETGLSALQVDLKGALSLDEALARVRDGAHALPAGDWLRGRGWDQHFWQPPAFPDRRALDAVCGDRPVALVHTSGHALWCSTAALRLAGIDASTSDPAGGRIERDVAGEATGILLDAAMALVVDALPRLTDDDRRRALLAGIAHAHRLGVTTVHDMAVGRAVWRQQQALHAEGELRLRLRVYLAAGRLDDWLAAGYKTGDGDAVLRIGGVKVFADGALGPLTAAMLEPYEGEPDNLGVVVTPPEELREIVRRCAAAGLTTAIHAIGDRANREVLAVYERELTVDQRTSLRPRVEHAQLLHPDDLPRFAALGILASMQPVHATQDMGKCHRHWGERSSGAYAFRTLLDSGATIAFGSDSPVETMDPLAGLHAAVTRQRPDGIPAGGWHPGQRVSVDEALRRYFEGGAEAAGDEGFLGRIASRFAGDLIVLSDNVFEIEPETIAGARVELTIWNGEVVFDREG
jgi:predicted amidohydrolase YtcJ